MNGWGVAERQVEAETIKVHHFQEYEFLQQLPQRDLQSWKSHILRLQNYNITL